MLPAVCQIACQTMQMMMLSSQCRQNDENKNALTYLKAGEAPIVDADADADADDELNGGGKE